MNRSIARIVAALAVFFASAATAGAQQAVTVTGYVTSRGAALQGAHVRIDELQIDRATDASGRYSFVIPSNRVRGQDVRVVASMQDRRIRYIPKSAAITLRGGALTQDFDLAVAGDGQPIVAAGDSASPRPAAVKEVPIVGDTVDLTAIAGPVDLPSALAGRIPGLDVVPASIPGGSALLVYRGARSMLHPAQPVFVVDGVMLDNTVFTSQAQRLGLGGFDYGSAVADVDPDEVATVRLVTGAEATRRFGGRAANGVIEITTRRVTGAAPLSVSASFTKSTGSVVRLPTYQNQFGQGLDGKFDFFNGRGGGINDAVDQSWGPALDGRPITQASYTEAGRPDVRIWSARPDNVRNYFESGSSSAAHAAVEGATDLGSYRAFVASRDARGLTPRDQWSRLDGGARVTVQPNPRLQASLNVFGSQSKNSNSSGTGFNEGNPVSQFTRMGRQVDTDSLRKHLRDATGKQVNWIYTAHNNPYFASLVDSNHARRYHTGGGGAASYALSPWLRASANAGVDYYRDGRLFTIASGSLGGFPFYTGRGDFSRGGSEGDEISVQQTTGQLRLDGTRSLASGGRWTFAVGADQRARRERVRSLGVDSALNVPSAGAPDTAKLPSVATWIAHSRTNAVFVESGVSSQNGLSLVASARNEWSAILPGQHATSIYPAVRASADLIRALPALRNGALGAASVHGEWWRAGSDLDPYTIQTMYAGRPVSGTVAPLGFGLLVADPTLVPEATNGLAVGADFRLRSHRIGLGVTLYSEKTSDVILPVPDATIGAVARNAGAISNTGAEATLTVGLGDGQRGLAWDLSATATKNSNQVDRLFGSASSLPLGPNQAGLNVEAQVGQPLGVLMGRRFLRDPSGALVLRAGLPLPDSIAGPVRLGVAQPDWGFSIRNSIQYRWVTLSAIAEGRMGGSVFSLTNLWGNYAGTLAPTSFRPDSGLLIAGIDASTGRANAQHVSTQNYYHALGAIHEAWVYDASYLRLNEARITVKMPTGFARLPFETVSASLIGRNLYLSADAPNIDPSAVFSPYQLRGVEMGQLPSTRSIGFQLAITP